MTDATPSRVAGGRPRGRRAARDAALDAGLAQVARYLARAWSRAGIAPGGHDDCTQAVHLGLIEAWGVDRFREAIAEVGRRGLREALGRGSAGGADFLRAVDRVKKRSARARRHVPLDAAGEPAWRDGRGPRSEALLEALGGLTRPRDAELVAATMAGERPAEIAARWGLASKTVCNQKARVLRSLRRALLAAPC